MFKVFLGLGSNLGDRIDHLTKAVKEIGLIGVINSLSSVYETEPVGFESDQLFYNMVLNITTVFRPPELLKKIKQIEKNIGRKRSTAYLQDREIDIDILLYHGFSYEDADVRVPHPGLEYRRFVLEPFNEIAPTAIHPILSQTIATLLRNCRDRSRVMRTRYVLNFEI